MNVNVSVAQTIISSLICDAIRHQNGLKSFSERETVFAEEVLPDGNMDASGSHVMYLIIIMRELIRNIEGSIYVLIFLCEISI